MRPFIKGKGLHVQSQNLPPAYVVNGAFYLISPEDLREHRSFYKSDGVPLVMEELNEGLDIDTKLDWMIAESVLQFHSPEQINRR